jgi:hypothetical protein
MIGWLDGWMVGWLDGWMADWMDGWMVGWLTFTERETEESKKNITHAIRIASDQNGKSDMC